MKKEKITISSISNVLGVSTVSVSRALSGQNGVSEELKLKIIKKAKELGYVKSNKSSSSNILVLHIKPLQEDNSNFSSMVQGIEKELQNNNLDYSVEFVDMETQDKFLLPYKVTKGIFFDGAILIGRFKPEYANLLGQKINNLIYFTGYSPAYDYDSVWFSFIRAGYMQSEYLIKKGHKNIGFIRNDHHIRNKEKLLGITTAFEDYNIPIKNNFIIDVEDNSLIKVKELLDKKNLPTAFICENDFSAFELIKLLNENNIKVPEDISVISSGNTDISTLCSPTLTTLDLNINYACTAVVSTLLKRISFPEKPSENVAILSRLIERESVRSL